MAAVIDPKTKKCLGVVTLEDVIEELIQEEILDEEDLAEYYQAKAQKMMAQALRFSKGSITFHIQ